MKPYGYYQDNFKPSRQTLDMLLIDYGLYIRTLDNDNLIAEFYNEAMNRGHEYFGMASMELHLRMDVVRR